MKRKQKPALIQYPIGQSPGMAWNYLNHCTNTGTPARRWV